MDQELNYIMCEYCGELLSIGQDEQVDHISKCAQIDAGNYDEENDVVVRCYTCGEQNKTYSGSQRSKQERARCIQCVEKLINLKAAPYKELAFNVDPPKHTNACLCKYVSDIDYNKVKEVLENGADANYNRQGVELYRGRWRCLYKKDGSEVPEINAGQPTTPLKMCVFRFSDCLLGKEEQLRIIEIAKLLIKYGAEREGALELYKMRYGYPEHEQENDDASGTKDDPSWVYFFKLLDEKQAQL